MALGTKEGSRAFEHAWPLIVDEVLNLGVPNGIPQAGYLVASQLVRNVSELTGGNGLGLSR
jgi:hypothetical protein